MTHTLNTIIDTARQWIDHDPDPDCRAELLTLIDKAPRDPQAEEDLRSRFAGPLTFGTAGLRGRVGAGETRMNRAVVIRATAGLMAWLNSKIDTPRVVIGCDARHGSSDFMDDAAAVVSAAGGEALVLPKRNPTPLTAFAVRHLHADAGIMVTASHNPPADNGYKVYVGGRIDSGEGEGVQIIPPADAEIAHAIADAPAADQVARTTDSITPVDVRDAYVKESVELAQRMAPHKGTDIRIVLTPMHGVGATIGVKALAEAGFRDVHVVKAQEQPDPDFPTVPFPNPEEDGALDLAKELAAQIKADVIIALDPDADRCAVCAPDPKQGWMQLSGDQMGTLVGDYVAARLEERGVTDATLASSIVSSRLLGPIAKSHGMAHQMTLTGFKWIARTPGIVYGYEEAIGFCPNPRVVKDKDGIAASIVVASMVSELKAQGKTIGDALDDLARRHGLYYTQPLTFRVEDTSMIAQGMANLRKNPPQQLAGSVVVETHDLSDGYNGLPPTDGMMFVTKDNDRVVVRPSGTEPKLKCYLEVVVPVEGHDVPWEYAHKRMDIFQKDVGKATGLVK